MHSRLWVCVGDGAVVFRWRRHSSSMSHCRFLRQCGPLWRDWSLSNSSWWGWVSHSPVVRSVHRDTSAMCTVWRCRPSDLKTTADARCYSHRTVVAIWARTAVLWVWNWGRTGSQEIEIRLTSAVSSLHYVTLTYVLDVQPYADCLALRPYGIWHCTSYSNENEGYWNHKCLLRYFAVVRYSSCSMSATKILYHTISMVAQHLP